MKKVLFILIALLVLPIAIFAQSSIIDDINASKGGQGKVRLMQDESISKLIGSFHVTTPVKTVGAGSSSSDFIKVRGWRIQVFSGNQQTSKAEAENRKTRVYKAFPDLEAFLSYSAPTWRLRVGNFVDKETADEKLAEMKDVLPYLAKEMYLVEEVIKLSNE